MMAGEYQASFSTSVRREIRTRYHDRCVVCLTWIRTTQCAHLLDAGTQGEFQYREAVKLGVLHEGFKRNAEMNGIVRCLALFTQNSIVLSLPIPVLKYLEEYVSSTSQADLKPLHQVFDLLADPLNEIPADLPEPADIIPYIGLFTLVTLDPAVLDIMMTPLLPGLSIIRGNTFEEAPANTSSTATNVARIFDSLDVDHETPLNIARIPLAPGVAAFEEKRYWRIPVSAGAIFAALIARLQYDVSGCEEILLARRIVGHLMVKYSGRSVPSGGPSGGRGGRGRDRGRGRGRGRGGGRGSGGGSREGGLRRSKRKNPSGEGNKSADKGRMKARRVAGGHGAGESGECSDASVEVLRSLPVPLEPYWNVEFPPGVRSQSEGLEIASSTRTLGDDMPALDTNEDNSDSESGRSISPMSPPGEDDPKKWRFGPSFSTNKIVFTARALGGIIIAANIQPAVFSKGETDGRMHWQIVP
ncbi:hypothetical protein D9615_006535 [Tricholomella constricta]|uniref:Uncharacterized protein n=1 Tax=Tricholomella constricta TaxID=117010 RepID=A0A8H5M304_9AGAR|nr:hypothetical protein D9615_006535 [Tricholomella constricta]